MKILIINPFGIGDALFTVPVVRAIKEKYPDSFVGYWCNERVGELVESIPGINKIFPLSRGDVKRVYRGLKRGVALVCLISQIRKERFDVAFDFSLDSRYGLWSKLAGIKKRVGFDYKGRGRFLADKINLKGYFGKHVIEYNLDLLRLINIEPKDKSLKIAVSGEDKNKARSTLKEYGVAATDLLIGVAPGGGASWGKDAIYKQWPAEKFAEVVDRLIKDSNVKVVLLGSADEKPIADIVRKNNNRIIDLTGKLSLRELAAVISELKVLVCNDGGPLHMAVALGVKTVSLFGPVDEKVYGPYPPSAEHIVVKKDVSCRPCYKDFRFTGCSNDRRCLDDIDVDEVFEKVKNLS